MVDKPASLRRDLLSFLKRLDEHVTPGQNTDLYLSGGAAILLAYNGNLATVDVDFIGEQSGLLLELSQFAAKDSEVHRQTKLYLDIVPPGIFPSALGWRSRAIPVTAPELRNVRIWVLEIHDLVISKLKRFAGKDRQDVRWLCGRRELDVSTLRARYREARLLRDHDERQRMDENFNVVEEEFLSREPTRFD